jgi:hypothetical protein
MKRTFDQKKTAGEATRPSKAFTGPASSERLVCAPGPTAYSYYRGPAPQYRRPNMMWFYKPIQTDRGTTPISKRPRHVRRTHPAGLTLAALVVLALATPRALSGFLAPLRFDTGFAPHAVAVGDLNGDGIPDLVTANLYTNNVNVLLGNGDGTFKAAVNYTAGTQGTIILSVAVGDLNGDGNLDLVVTFSPGTVSSSGLQIQFGGTIAVLLGNGDGTFQSPHTYAIGDANYLALVDLNRDGILDVVVADFNGNTVNVLLGKGDGTFQAVPHYSAANGPQAVAVRDLNGDGIADLVTANTAGNNVSVLLGRNDGTFQEAVNYPAGRSPVSVAVGDFNGDGIPDLAVANQASANVSILLGNGDGTFRAAVDYRAGTTPNAVAVGDFNGDSIPDLAVVFQGGVDVLLGNGDGTFKTMPISYVAGANPAFVVAADFNGDGHPDLAVANSESNDVSILFNDGKWEQ